jgi:hypothetical protein
VSGAQEAEAVGQHLHDAIAEDRLAFLGAVLEQRKDQFLLAQAVGAFDFVGNGHFEQLADVERLELREVHGRQRWERDWEGMGNSRKQLVRQQMCSNCVAAPGWPGGSPRGRR